MARPGAPIGRMSARKGGAGRNIRLWDLDAPAGSTAAELLQAYQGALNGIDRLEARKAEMANSAEYTPEGIKRQSVDWAFKNVVPEFEKGKLVVQRAKAEVKARRSKLQLPPIDKTDAAGAAMRAEIRGMLRSLDQKGRDAFIKEAGGFSGLDPQIRSALIEAPAAMSGISASFRDELLQQAMHAEHGAELDHINELERAIQIASSALGETSDEVRLEAISADPSNADPDTYAQRVKQGGNLQDALWLRKSVEGGQEVTRVMKKNAEGQTILALATPDDVAGGIFADSHEEYERLKASTPIFAGDDGGRAARAAYVDEHGLDAYLNRNRNEGS